MPERRILVSAPEGLHARPVAELARIAQGHPTGVTLGAPGRDPVDAASILAVMNLGVVRGETVIVSAEGAGADEVLDEVARTLGC